MSKRNIKLLSGREREYLNSWLFRYGKVNLRKYNNVPDIVLNQYERDLITNNKTFIDNTSQQRLNFINEYIDFIMTVEARYKRLLKQYKMKGWEFGVLFGYKSSVTWHKSYKRYTYIRAFITLINKHEELLTRLNNPIGHNKR